MAQESHDQRPAELALGLAGAIQAAKHRVLEQDAAPVRLRVEEQLGVHDLVGRGAPEVGHRHVEEVFFLKQHAGAGVVDVEKALQVGERIGCARSASTLA